MELLIRHFEKIVLVLCMIFLMLSLFMVNSKVSGYAARSKQTKQDSVRKISGGEVLPELDLSGFNGVRSISDSRNLIHVTPAKYGSRSGLFMPAAYILCKNPDCSYMMNFNEDACPFCKTENDPVGKEPTMQDDVDGDGIPDLVEKKYPDFLNFLNPDDGFADQDGDGFLNAEEYKAGTKMNDQTSHPDLALLLRSFKVFKRPIPFVFTNLRTLGSDNKNDWKIVFRDGASTVTKQLNDTIRNFKILRITDDGREVTVLSDNNVEYYLPLGKPVSENDFSAIFLFLASRQRQAVRQLFRTRRYLKRNGDNLELKKQIGERIVREFYKIRIEDENTVKIGKLDASKERVVVEYTVPKIDFKKDFEKAERENRNSLESSGVPLRRRR